MADGLSPQPNYYDPEIKLDAAPVCWDFLNDNSFVTGIMGPLGSGKSYTCCAKLMKLACQQMPSRNGFRKTRWAIIRNTYPELRTTTIKTWLELWPEASCGPMRYSHPITHHIKRSPSKNFQWTDRDQRIFVGQPGIDAEFIFMAMDKPDDIKHLKSLDLTGAFINEACETPDGVIDMLTGRVGRFPQVADVPATWAGVIMDTNAMDDQNWWYKAAEEGVGVAENIEIEGLEGMDFGWRFYRQPPAVLEVEQQGSKFYVVEAGYERAEVSENHILPAAGRQWVVNAGAENLKYLRAGYYHQQVQNKSLDWINRYMQAKYVFMVEGKPWVPEYSDQVMGQEPLVIDKDRELFGGIDAGGGTLNPAAVIGQKGEFGDWRVHRELSLFDIGIERFSEALHHLIATEFDGRPVKFGIDPAGRGRDQIYETTVEDHLRTRGFDVQLAPSNSPEARREALALPMGRMIVVNSKPVPGFRVDPSGCPMLRAGLASKWYRKTIRTSGQDPRYEERPYKNQWSHVCDASSYMTSTFGEHQSLTQNSDHTGRQAFNQPVQMDTGFDVYGGR